MVNLMVVCLQYMQSRHTDVDILMGLLVGLNKAPQAYHMHGQLLMIHGAGAPQVPSPFGGLLLFLFGPCVLAPSEEISNRIRTSPRGPSLSVILLLMFRFLLGQSVFGPHTNKLFRTHILFPSFGRPILPIPVILCSPG